MDPLVFISLLIATPLIWLSWIFQSGFSRSQRIVYLTGVLAYFVALSGFSMTILWQYRYCGDLHSLPCSIAGNNSRKFRLD
jgi:hypothetical protein